MRVENATIEIESHVERGLIDLTPHIGEVLRQHKVDDGLLTLVSASSTTGIMILDDAAETNKGIVGLLDIVGGATPAHPDLDMEASRVTLEAALAGTTCSLPVMSGKLLIGHGRRVYLVECGGPGYRRVLVHILADSAIDHTVLETEGGQTLRADDVLRPGIT